MARLLLLVALAAVAAARLQSVPQPVRGTSSKGQVLTCVISGRDDEVVPKMVSVDMSKPKARMSKGERSNMRQCFSGGRGRRRFFMMKVDASRNESSDFGGTVSIRREGTFDGSNVSFVATNYRKEAMKVSFSHFSMATNGTPVPVEKVVMPGQEVLMASFTPRFTKNVTVGNVTKAVPKWRPFDYFWTAEPVQYGQQEVVHQLYSNNVFLAIQHKTLSSTFVVFNERHEIDAPIRVWLNVVAAAHSDIENLVFKSGGKQITVPLELEVTPREKRTVLDVTPKDASKPWGYAFEYRWTAGVVPSDLFAVPHPQMVIA